MFDFLSGFSQAIDPKLLGQASAGLVKPAGAVGGAAAVPGMVDPVNPSVGPNPVPAAGGGGPFGAAKNEPLGAAIQAGAKGVSEAFKPGGAMGGGGGQRPPQAPGGAPGGPPMLPAAQAGASAVDRITSGGPGGKMFEAAANPANNKSKKPPAGIYGGGPFAAG